MREVRALFFVLIIVISRMSPGQTISSLYSSYGIGEVAQTGLQHNFAMGDVGIGMPSPLVINLRNPSMLFYNSLSSFSVGLMGDFRSYNVDDVSATSNTASLRFLALAFPVVRSRWATAISLLPYSAVNYNSFSVDSLATGVAAINRYQGSGGLSSLSWSNSVRLYKSLAIGIKSSFIFGNITKDSRSELTGEGFDIPYIINYKELSSYRDINLQLSISNKFNLSNNRFINVGAVYDLSGELSGSLATSYERFSSSSLLLSQDLEEVDIVFTLPRSFGLGVSYQVLNKLMIGADMDFKQWPNASQGESENNNDAISFAVGAELIPDYQNVSNYLKRGIYRAGLSFKELPYLVENTQINDFGINFGVALPVSGYSNLETAFKYGWRGTNENGLVRESYWQVVLGATINDRWFIKRKYD